MAGANTSANTMLLNRGFVREPFLPDPARWNDVYDMLCGHCANKADCGLIEAMLAFAQGRTREWPENAWVTDLGTSATCLSYAPIRGETISRQRLDALAHTPDEALPHVCGGCAAKKGTEASVALHTQRDYRAAVRDQSEFTCHEDPENKRLCGGWCRAVQRKEV
ncbi:MAG: hypothetical protein J0I28_07360 [Caulobacterales bacterium]|nr:hypothetical protein [Caulobacterales bacterium]